MRVQDGQIFLAWISLKVNSLMTILCFHNRYLGRKLHSWQYKSPHGFEDKVVLVIGIGNSAGDMVVELGRFAKQVENLILYFVILFVNKRFI